jgi:tetratricopeptide (TPR) repeat protein
MAGSLMSGDRALAVKFADHLPRAYPDMAAQKDDMSFSQARRFIIYARYEPARMLALPEPAADSPETRSFYHYARGEAFASQGDAKSLAAEADKITGDDRAMKVARAVLAGRLAVLQGRFSDAARSFEQAATEEDGFPPETMDPPPWWYPVRRSAAAAYLQAGDFARAAEQAKESLNAWPNDALALLVLSRAEDGLGHAADARHDQAAAIGSWEGDLSKIDIGRI